MGGQVEAHALRRKPSTIRKVLRTLQSEVPFLRGVKEAVFRQGRRLLRVAHERDFRVLKLLPDSMAGCYLDVGANHGQSIESILLYHPRAQIISFEANPGLAEKLRRRYAEDENIRVVGEALGAEVGRFPLFVPTYKFFTYDALASLNRDVAQGWLSAETVFGFDPRRLQVAEVECIAGTLDSHQLEPVFMKVDVQGCEHDVLAGARETLRRCEPILLLEDFHNDPRTVALAEEMGYQEYAFDGRSLRPGAGEGPNSLLLTERRLRELRPQ